MKVQSFVHCVRAVWISDTTNLSTASDHVDVKYLHKKCQSVHASVKMLYISKRVYARIGATGYHSTRTVACTNECFYSFL